MPRPSSNAGPTPVDNNRRIEELRQRPVATTSTAEDLSLPLDPDITVNTVYPHHKIDFVVEGKPVSGLTVCDFQQRIGGALVRMGGLAGVWTHNDHRFRGYSRRVISNALRWMRGEGFDTSMLYGIPCYYPKFGYAPAFPSACFHVALRDAESVAPSGLRVVDFAPAHLKGVLRIFKRDNASRTGPVWRDARQWKPFRKGLGWNSRAICRVALDRRGRVAGYIVFHDEHLATTVLEVAAGPDSTPGAAGGVFAALIHAAARRALALRVDRICFRIPEEHPFTEFCKPLGIRRESVCPRDGGAMVRMINTATTLTKIAPILASRVGGAGGLTIRTNLDTASLTWRRGRLRVHAGKSAGLPVADLPQWALAQLVYGYRSAGSFVDTGLLRGPGPALAQLDRLFPVTPHFLSAVDEF